jgi:2-isopropylmalate synthase
VVKAQQLGLKVTNDTPELRQILDTIKQREHEGYEFEAAEASMALLIRNILKHEAELKFTVEKYHVSMRRDLKQSVCEATVRVRVGKKIHDEVAEGDGPVNALDSALRSALAKSFPKLKKVTLTDYKVRILDGVAGTAAKTRVLIQSTDGQREWGTVGVSENIIEASLQALVDSMEFALIKKSQKHKKSFIDGLVGQNIPVIHIDSKGTQRMKPLFYKPTAKSVSGAAKTHFSKK